MAAEATVSETMEDVLRELGFKRTRTTDMWRRRPRAAFEKELAAYVRRSDGLLILRMGQRMEPCSPERFRRIVAAEVACAAAWRGEEEAT